MLSVVIIDFRSSDLVGACIRSLTAGSLVPDEIVVVDNEGSAESDHGDELDRPPIRRIAHQANPGYAAACNMGARAARGDLLLFMNADVTVSGDCLQRCVDALASDERIGIVTCRLDRPDGSLDHACHRGLPTPGASLAYKLRLHRLFPRSRRLSRYTMAWLDPGTEHDVEACSGAFLLISREVLEQAGGWDERYRFYAEDLDLCLRVRELGRSVRYVGTTSATHVKGAFSHSRTPDSQLDAEQRAVKRWVRREVARSHRLFFEEHMRRAAPRPVRAAIRLLFALEELRLGALPGSART